LLYIDCGVVPYWHAIYEQFILPSFAVTAREEQYPSKYWLENPKMLLYGHDDYLILDRLVRGRQHEPTAPWENPFRQWDDKPLEADGYKSVKAQFFRRDQTSVQNLTLLMIFL